MLDFLSEAKRRILLQYPFIMDFLSGKVNKKVFLENLKMFKSELLSKGINEADLEQVVENQELVKKIEIYDPFYKKKEPIKTAVKRALAIAERMKEKMNLKEIVDRSNFIRNFRLVYLELSKYGEEQLDRIIENPNRIFRINNARWRFASVNVEDMGVWPGMGEIDRFTTSGNLPDTSEKINEIRTGDLKQEWPKAVRPYVPKEAVTKLISIRRNADIIYRLFPIVVTTKGPKNLPFPRTTRYNVDEEYKKKYGFGYVITPFDIDDGAHRAVAFTMLGLKRIKCFVGDGLTRDRV